MTRHRIFPALIALCAAAAVGGAAPALANPASGTAASAGKKHGSAAAVKHGQASGAAPATAGSATGQKPSPKSGGGAAGAARMPHGFESTRPWAAGVSATDQKQAVMLFEQGNKLLKESLFSAAVKKYRAALSHWDHPAIHYNMALALLNLDQPVQLYKNLEKAVAYGVAPLDDTKFRHAKRYMRLVRKTLAKVDISCDKPGAKVSMDGKFLFTAPGRYHGIVLAGDHNIVAAKSGFVTDNETRTLEPGGQATFKLQLYTAEQLTRYHRRWSAWEPWAVVGAGVGIGLAGGLLQLEARNNFSSYDAGIRACSGCVPDAHLAGLKSSANTDQALAIVSYALGGAAVVGGLALVYVNRLQPYRVEADHLSGPARLSVAPLLGGGTTGVTALFRF